MASTMAAHRSSIECIKLQLLLCVFFSSLLERKTEHQLNRYVAEIFAYFHLHIFTLDDTLSDTTQYTHSAHIKIRFQFPRLLSFQLLGIPDQISGPNSS